MKSLLLSTLCFLLLSNTYSYGSNNASKKSGWGFPILTAIGGIFKNASTGNNPTPKNNFDDDACVTVDLETKTTSQQNQIITPPTEKTVNPQVEEVAAATITFKKFLSDQNFQNKSLSINTSSPQQPGQASISPQQPGQASIKSSRNNTPDSTQARQIELYNRTNKLESQKISRSLSASPNSISPMLSSRKNSQESILSSISSQAKNEQTDDFNPGSANLSRSNSYLGLADINNSENEISETQSLLTSNKLSSNSVDSTTSNDSGFGTAEAKNSNDFISIYLNFCGPCIAKISNQIKNLSNQESIDSKNSNNCSSSSIKSQQMDRPIDSSNKKKVE